MAYSYVKYVADGVTDTFAITFPYLQESHVKVFLNDELQTSGYTITPAGQVLFQAPVPKDVVLTIRRETPKIRRVDFQDGSLLDEATLDYDANQLVYIVQELLDEFEAALTANELLEWDAKGRRIVNLGEPKELTDAATLGSLLDVLEQAVEAAKDAENAKKRAEEIYRNLRPILDQITIVATDDPPPIPERKEGTFYFYITDEFPVFHSTMRISPNMGIKIIEEA